MEPGIACHGLLNTRPVWIPTWLLFTTCNIDAVSSKHGWHHEGRRASQGQHPPPNPMQSIVSRDHSNASGPLEVATILWVYYRPQPSVYSSEMLLALIGVNR